MVKYTIEISDDEKTFDFTMNREGPTNGKFFLADKIAERIVMLINILVPNGKGITKKISTVDFKP